MHAIGIRNKCNVQHPKSLRSCFLNIADLAGLVLEDAVQEVGVNFQAIHFEAVDRLPR